MKIKGFFILGYLSIALVNGQNVGINPTGASPNADAALDVDYSNKGLLIPRVNITSLTTFNPPITSGGNTASLLVYNTNTTTGIGYHYWNGSQWVKLLANTTPADAWLTTGNSGTNSSVNFLGTTDAQNLVFKTNNTERMRILSSNGYVGIGIINPLDLLTVNGNIMLHSTTNDGPRLVWRGGPTFTEEYRARFTSDYLGFFPYEIGNPNYIGEVLVLKQNGNVGIRTISPQVLLHMYQPTGNATLRIEGSNNSVHKGVQVCSSTDGWFMGVNNSNHFVINRDIPVGNGTNVMRIYESGSQERMTEFIKGLNTPGNGGNSDWPTTVLIKGGAYSNFYNDWPFNWDGGLATWDIVGASIYMSSYLTRSDERFKVNIKDINHNGNLLEKFMQLKPVEYDFNRNTIKADESEYQRKHFGFIANDVEKIFPNIVVNAGTDPSIPRGLEYDAFIPVLIKIVQEQQLQIEELKKQNNELNDLNSNIQSQLNLIKSTLQIESSK